MKILANNFKGQVLPGAKVEVINDLGFPMLAVKLPPRGIKLFIRAGVPFLEDMRRVRNQYFYEEVYKLLHKSRVLKTTIECTLVPKNNVSLDTIQMALLSLNIRLDQFDLCLTDMVFEHTPAIKASVRMQGLLNLFRDVEVDNCVHVAHFNQVNNNRDFGNFLKEVSHFNTNRIAVLNPDSHYDFDLKEDLGSLAGACVDLNDTFRAKIIDIVPKLSKRGYNVDFEADYIIAKDRGVTIKIPINVCNDIFWKHRKKYIGKSFLYKGIKTPTSVEPLNREFFKFID